MRKYSIKEELNEDEQMPAITKPGVKAELASSQANNRHHSHKPSKSSKIPVEEDSDYSDKDYDMDGEEAEQKMRDELEREVNKKIEQQMQGASLSHDASKESLWREQQRDDEDHTYDLGDGEDSP